MSNEAAGDFCPICEKSILIEEPLGETGTIFIICTLCNAVVNSYTQRRKTDKKRLKTEPVKIRGKSEEICVRCQECCKWTTFILTAPSEELLHHYRIRGFTIKTIKNRHHIMVPTVCPYLIASGCYIYKARPQTCRDYDGRDDPVMRSRCQLPKRKEEVRTRCLHPEEGER